ncbi:hypothetical protein COO59_12120 [Mixta theicola]|uniref:Phosphoesterase n=1 Tax=Mixta theicola TaxID=1458355 RepID=A0A2K1Q8K8_9GAMM|nr:metallophosphoesterase [Mixta theicola]PNS11369.1 hypothetical protein COO59_12120 [Mixta theicola]GLR10477.1 hypothetical protein GCM10007905_31970 [Mixta theicola]
MKYNRKEILLISLLFATAFNSFADEFKSRDTASNSMTGVFPVRDPVFDIPSNDFKPWSIGVRYLIMADPQAWRMGQGPGSPDPNSSKTASQWEDFNREVVLGINSKIYDLNIKYGIINGDITEFGRDSQLKSYHTVYDRLAVPVMLGYGNHDYERNVRDCTRPEYLDFSTNACAYMMLGHLGSLTSNYSHKLKNFSIDSARKESDLLLGSQAYSWDEDSPESGKVHFVQLHLAPTYSVYINNSFAHLRYFITDSLSWLRHDLDHARLRGANHIFVNFHALEWINEATDYEKQVLKAIFDEYKVSAVFVGHTHYPAVTYHHLFGNVPVYTSGALYAGYFDILNVKKDSFQVQSYRVTDDKVTMIYDRGDFIKPAPPPKCYRPGEYVPAGHFVRTELIPDENQTFLLRQVKTSNALDANAEGDVYTNKLNTANPYMRWKLQHMWTDSNNEKYYKIIHVKDNKVLDGDSKGNIYTRQWNGGAYQYWALLKYSYGGIIQLRSLGTKRILDANAGRDVYGTNSTLKFTNNYQNWELTDLQGNSVPAVRYFKAKRADSSSNPLPNRDNSDQYWEYAGEKGITKAAPCI